MHNSPFSWGPKASPVSKSTILPFVLGSKTPHDPILAMFSGVTIASGDNSVIPQAEYLKNLVHLIIKTQIPY